MRKFTCVADIGDLAAAVAEALEVKRDRFAYQHLGRNKTLLMIFFNSSLRTRLSDAEQKVSVLLKDVDGNDVLADGEAANTDDNLSF